MSKSTSTSSETENSDMSSECSSEECLDYNVSKHIEQEELDFLLSKTSIFDDALALKDNILDEVYITSNDIVLYYAIMCKYESVFSALDKKIKKCVNKLLDDRNVAKNKLHIIITGKLCNMDPRVGIQNFCSLAFEQDYYLFVSKCSFTSKEDKQDICKMFSFVESDIDSFPVCLEEIFLLEIAKHTKVVVYGSVPYRLYLLNKEELSRYIEVIKKEAEQ